MFIDFRIWFVCVNAWQCNQLHSLFFHSCALFSGTCVDLPSEAGSCHPFLGSQKIYIPRTSSVNFSQWDSSVSFSQRLSLYADAKRVLLKNGEKNASLNPCFLLVHRMLCEYIYSPCDPSSIKFASKNMAWPRQVCRTDCQIASESCRELEEFKKIVRNTGGSLNCDHLPDSDGGKPVECLKSLRFGKHGFAHALETTLCWEANWERVILCSSTDSVVWLLSIFQLSHSVVMNLWISMVPMERCESWCVSVCSLKCNTELHGLSVVLFDSFFSWTHRCQ